MLEIDDIRTKEVHIAPKGGKFRILKEGPLFYIAMENGGVKPKITEQKFTNYKLALNTLYRYFEANPKPVPKDEKKTTTNQET